MSMSRVARACALCAVLTACGKSEAPSPAVEAPAPKQAPAPAEKRPVFEDATFKLALSGEPTFTAGQPAQLAVGLEARGGYHVNQEYPVRVDLSSGPGVTFQKKSLARADAASFDEQRAKFDVGFTAQPGTHEIVATVDFAVCTAETCVPDQRTLALSVDVK